MQELESDKIKQDLLINHLQEKINNFKSQYQIYKIQLKIQQEETLSAKEILRESLEEMDIIKNEKREYITKWKSSVIELNKRDNILKSIFKHLNDIEEEIRLKKIEIIQYEKDIINEKENIDSKQMMFNKIKNDKIKNEKKNNENIKIRQGLLEKLGVLKAIK